MQMSTEHYESLLADVYDWMQGGWEAKTEASRNQLAHQGITGPSTPRARAIDIGAGTGYQSIPLAELGYAVTAIDPSASMLAQLATHIGDLSIETTTALFEAYTGPAAELICCMGDTLTHFTSHRAVDQLFERCRSVLLPGGQLLLTYRDGTDEIQGDQRFLPIRSDRDRIFTCFLETIDTDHTRVHDLVHVRNGDGFDQRVSSYTKLRLRPEQLDASLSAAGFRRITTNIAGGLVTTSATTQPHEHGR